MRLAFAQFSGSNQLIIVAGNPEARFGAPAHFTREKTARFRLLILRSTPRSIAEGAADALTCQCDTLHPQRSCSLRLPSASQYLGPAVRMNG
jgi:hypothetical protein